MAITVTALIYTCVLLTLFLLQKEVEQVVKEEEVEDDWENITVEESDENEMKNETGINRRTWIFKQTGYAFIVPSHGYVRLG